MQVTKEQIQLTIARLEARYTELVASEPQDETEAFFIDDEIKTLQDKIATYKKLAA